MSSLSNKKILLGVTGGIAAYKSAEIIRQLTQEGCEIQVVMTQSAQAFITPLTLQALSGKPVRTSLLDPEAEAGMGHIELARWADLIIIAPCSANMIAKLHSGLADDLLSTICLATNAPIALVPAMNQLMWSNQATQANIATLQKRNMLIWGPAEGLQACGDIGLGRMLEPLGVVAHACSLFETGDLAGTTIVITAGPTREPLDPVRYLSNHSSGKMGYALASAAAEAGAKTILITGPTALPQPSSVTTVHVLTADEMLTESLKHAKHADIFIGAAAVVDYKPLSISTHKIKKGSSDTMSLELTKNPDIIATIAQLENRPYTVGFAAETHNVIDYAKQKLKAKNLDLIIANDVSNSAIGFNSDNNAVTILDHPNITSDGITIPECNKNKLSREILRHIARRVRIRRGK